MHHSNESSRKNRKRPSQNRNRNNGSTKHKSREDSVMGQRLRDNVACTNGGHDYGAFQDETPYQPVGNSGQSEDPQSINYSHTSEFPGSTGHFGPIYGYGITGMNSSLGIEDTFQVNPRGSAQNYCSGYDEPAHQNPIPEQDWPSTKTEAGTATAKSRHQPHQSYEDEGKDEDKDEDKDEEQVNASLMMIRFQTTDDDPWFPGGRNYTTAEGGWDL